MGRAYRGRAAWVGELFGDRCRGRCHCPRLVSAAHRREDTRDTDCELASASSGTERASSQLAVEIISWESRYRSCNPSDHAETDSLQCARVVRDEGKDYRQVNAKMLDGVEPHVRSDELPEQITLDAIQCECGGCGSTIYVSRAALEENDGGCPECDPDSTDLKIGVCECGCAHGVYVSLDIARHAQHYGSRVAGTYLDADQVAAILRTSLRAWAAAQPTVTAIPEYAE
jgi:hypothetical protein